MSSLLLLLVVLTTTSCAVGVVETSSTGGTTVTEKPPNILLLLADDLGYGEVEGFAPKNAQGRVIQTPNLSQRLASQSLKFTNFYSGESVCAPARCTLFTGKHTGHATIRGNRKGPDGYDYPLKDNPEDVTIAQILKDYANYKTGMVGKWCFGGLTSKSSPWHKGFDYFFGHLYQAAAHNMYPRYLWEKLPESRNATKISYPTNAKATRESCMKSNNTCQYSHSLFVDRALQYMDDHKEQQENGKDERPFFLYASFTIPHAGGWTGDFAEQGNPVPSDGRYSSGNDWPDVERDHAASITEYLDRDVGRILDKLDELHLTNNTVVIFTSDNGPHSEGGHNVNFFNSSGQLRGFKRSLYEGGIRVPFFISWPPPAGNETNDRRQFIPPNTTTDDIGWFPDLYTTLTDIAGIDFDALPPTDGYSLVDLITDPPSSLSSSSSSDSSSPSIESLYPSPPNDRVLYWEFCTNAKWGQALRQQDWKLISLDRPNQDWELYNLQNDPEETTDLASDNVLLVQTLERLANLSHVDDSNWPIGRSCIPSDTYEHSISFALDFS